MVQSSLGPEAKRVPGQGADHQFSPQAAEMVSPLPVRQFVTDHAWPIDCVTVFSFIRHQENRSQAPAPDHGIACADATSQAYISLDPELGFGAFDRIGDLFGIVRPGSRREPVSQDKRYDQSNQQHNTENAPGRQ
jgi:hypothetical protein